MNQCLDMFSLPIPEGAPNIKGVTLSVRPTQGAQPASCCDFASMLSAESALVAADNISSALVGTGHLNTMALALMGQQPLVATGEQVAVSSPCVTDAKRLNTFFDKSSFQLTGELLIGAPVQNIQTESNGLVQAKSNTAEVALPQMGDSELLTPATIQPQMVTELECDTSQKMIPSFLSLVFVPEGQGDAQPVFLSKASLTNDEASADTITAYLLTNGRICDNTILPSVTGSTVSGQFLVPVSLNLTQPQIQKLTELVHNANPKGSDVVSLTAIATANKGSVAQGTLGTVAGNAGQGQVLNLLMAGANVETMTVQLTLDPEKLAQLLESRSTHVTPTAQPVNPSDPTNELLPPINDTTANKETNLQDILPDPKGQRTHPDLAANLQKEISSNTNQTVNNLSNSFAAPLSLAESQHVTSNPEKVAIPAPLASPATVEVPESARFRVSFDRMQIESLLKRGEVKLKLNPPELGHMKVELTSSTDHVSAKFEITSEAAKRVVEYHLPQLRENLARAGVRIDQVEVVIHNDAQERQQPGYSDPQPKSQRAFVYDENESEPEATATPDPRVIAGSLNLLV
jgi:flagellar hook-length control protein FliK